MTAAQGHVRKNLRNLVDALTRESHSLPPTLLLRRDQSAMAVAARMKEAGSASLSFCFRLRFLRRDPATGPAFTSFRRGKQVTSCPRHRTRGHCALSAMLTVSQLSKSFAGRKLFDDVSLQVNRGDLIKFQSRSIDSSKRCAYIFAIWVRQLLFVRQKS